MDKNQSLIKIDDQLYKIQITKSGELLNIIMTTTVTHISYAKELDTIDIKEVTESAGYIRNVNQFYIFLNRGANMEPKYNLTGKINPQDDKLILSLAVRLDPTDDEITLYVIELSKIHKDPIVRMDEMMLDFYNIYANCPNNDEKIKNVVTDAIDNTKNDLVQLISNNKNDLVQLIRNNKNELTEAITISSQKNIEIIIEVNAANNKIKEIFETVIKNKEELTQQVNCRLSDAIVNCKYETMQLVNVNISKAKDELTQLVTNTKNELRNAITECDNGSTGLIKNDINNTKNELMQLINVSYTNINAGDTNTKNELTELINVSNTNTKNELTQLINTSDTNIKNELTQLINAGDTNTKNELTELINVSNTNTKNELTQLINTSDTNIKNELTELINVSNTNSKNEVVVMIKKLQEILDRNNLK